MGLNAWITVLVVVTVLALLVRSRIPPWLVLMIGLVILLTSGVLTTGEALTGFSNEGMLTVAALYIVAAGLRETGGLGGAAMELLGRSRRLPVVQLRLMLPVMGISAFINNTPVVAAFIPMVSEWARKFRMSPSRLMMPLSYAAIFGGTCTLIGTSTNLVVNGLLIDDPTQRGLGFFEIAWVGVPVALIGICWVLVTSRWLLPERLPPVGELSDPREYTVEMLVVPESPLAGRTVEQAGLRHLPGLFLVEIQRADCVLPAVGPEAVLREDDRLVFAGNPSSVADLQTIRGLEPATDQLFALDSPRADRRLVEAIVSPDSNLVGRPIRESRFRSRFDAVVIAVGRNGERLRGKAGDVVLRGGDMLLLESEPGFVRRHGQSRDFLLVRGLANAPVPRHERSVAAWAVVAAMVAMATTGWLSMLNAAFLAACAMILLRCVRARNALRSIDLEVLLVIAAAFGIGKALEVSGAAAVLGGGLLSVADGHPLVLLATVYLATSVLTELTTNNAAAVLMYPLAAAVATAAGLSVLPFAIAIMMAASASFATPIGYQTNLMVFGPGGYQFGDYLRFGVPMNVVAGITAVLVIPRIWGF
ncbi:MAG: SLC13 family permease [Chromatiales bacterium]|nr:SLC13 family permease [Chromatiales bacterium]